MTAIDADVDAAYIRSIGMKAANEKKRILEPRRSASASSSLKAEILRVSEMSVEERIRAALGMKQHFSSLRPTPSEG